MIKKTVNDIEIYAPSSRKELMQFAFKRHAVYNATLLASKTLAHIYHYTKNDEFKNLAFKSVKAVCLLQNKDGSFPHSDQVGQKWRYSFHTGFKLESLQFYQTYCQDSSFESNLENGFNYWVKNFF